MRKLILLCIRFTIGIIAILIISLIIWLYTSKKSAVYYVPSVDLYIKAYNPAFHDYYYIYLSKKNDFSNKAKTACIRVWKSDISNVDILIDPQANNEVFITDQYVDIYIDNQGSFTIKLIDWKDPVFFKFEYKPWRCIRNKPYLAIRIFFTTAIVYETQKDPVILKDISINDK